MIPGLVDNTLQENEHDQMHQKWVFGFKHFKIEYKGFTDQNGIIKKVFWMVGLLGSTLQLAWLKSVQIDQDHNILIAAQIA